MDIQREDKAKIDSIVPGIFDSYESLKISNGLGLFTSSGRFYNHAIFARDVASAARFVGFFDHGTARSIMANLIKYQGTEIRRRTQEQPGRIHHEYRNFSQWKARISDKLMLKIVGKLWGARRGELLTYYASDTTASFIRAVHRFALNIDSAFLDQVYPTKSGEQITVQQSVERAAHWIMTNVDSEGRFMVNRSSWSLPYQTLQDSVTAYSWADGKPVNYNQPHSFVEAQSFNASALENISHLLAGRSESVNEYKECAHRMRRTLLRDYWDSNNHYFTSVLSERDGVVKPLDVPNISAGWVLNASWWSEVPQEERHEKVQAVVDRLFSDEFLTPVGIRTRSKYIREPLGEVVDYHGAQTVWPMFNFMVIEGLRRHRLYRLAEEIENRVVNGVNTIGAFAEFLLVTKSGEFCQPKKDFRLPTLQAQMIPEKDIAFTIVPLMTIARSRTFEADEPAQELWQAEVESAVLSRIEKTPLYNPSEVAAKLQPKLVYLTRTGATMRSIAHIMKGNK
ncbi:hypothetical protein EOL73_01870 [Candidatus Saccharibacteria bacterium]|nr:hypothetical protein [Candidatus Saccharibacteria bacterium]NCU40483.1 hypothetical protein [Candidatus Saccharibacteria bacterium]